MAFGAYPPHTLKPITFDNIDQMQELGVLKFPDRVTGIKYSPGGKHLAVRFAERIVLWDMHSGEQYRSLEYNAWVEALTFSHDGKFLVISVGNPLNKTISSSSLHTWNVETGQEEYVWTPNVGIVSAIAFNPQNSDIIALVSYERHVTPPNAMSISNVGIELWRQRELVQRYTDFKQFFGEGENKLNPWGLEFSPDGKTLFVCSIKRGGPILAWEDLGNGALKAVTEPGESFSEWQIDRQGEYLAAHDIVTGKLLVRHLNSSAVVYSTSDAEQPHCLGFDGEGQMLVVAWYEEGNRAIVELVDIKSGKTGRKLFEPISSVAFSPDNRTLAVELIQSHEPGMQEIAVWGIPA